MALSELQARAAGFCRRTGARYLFRRPFAIRSQTAHISFTFDDFPRSALLTGGAILKRFRLTGTYYACLGLMGKQTCCGPMFLPEDLQALLDQGHELGCHTFGHCHSGETSTAVFEKSIIDNRLALRALRPEASFLTFSYPISAPRAWTKRTVAKHFTCSRGGGQTFNVGTTDLNYLSAYFLEKDREDPEMVRNLIRQNSLARGWLVFATHDIHDAPTPFGCSPAYFEEVVRCAVRSGARILPVAQALEVLHTRSERGVAASGQCGPARSQGDVEGSKDEEKGFGRS